jgi:ketosteroid isomerase-like protein
MSAIETGTDVGVAQRFMEALRSLEHDGDPAALADLYAEDSRSGNLQRPDGFQGREGARQFWLTYRSTFGDVRSEFRTVVASADAAALEWTTEGTVNGRPVRYDGVTVLELAGGEIVRSCAYYDPTWLGRETLRASAEAAADGADDATEREAGPGGVDARPIPEADGWRPDPEETG